MIFTVIEKCFPRLVLSRMTLLSVILWLGGLTLLVISLCAPVLYWAESSDPNANIQNWADSIWLSFMIVTTIGFGDFYPVTWVGRLIAVPLAATGIGVFGTLAGYLGSMLLDKVVRQATTDMLHEQNDRIEKLAQQNHDLNANIENMTAENKELNNLIHKISQENSELNKKIDHDTDEILKALRDMKK
jgi:uncharacterized protein YdbL (DUF1318 family)